MKNIKLLKEYTYMSICDIDFNVLIDFDYDDEVLLYSLKYEDHSYNSGDFLINFAKSLDEETIIKEIKSFMFNYIQSVVRCHIEENDYKDWEVKTTDHGLSLFNDKEHEYLRWMINEDDLEEGCERVKNEIIEHLDFINKQ